MNASMRGVTASACLSDDELAALATAVIADDPRLPHVESCDTCRAIWLHARDIDTATWNVGRYEVRGTLGAGGLGVVLLGWDPVLQREVAIKFPANRGTLLLREAQALAAIRHRNVVAVHDFGEVDGDVYFTMERVEGVPFDTWWLGAATPERLRAVVDIAAGLAAIHAAGLVHCDIKPGNIVVTQGGEVVIVDLGLATSHGDATAFAGGTPGFRAPELERGGAASVATDEYAFWCVVRACFATAKLSAGQRKRLDAMIARGTSAAPGERFGALSACGAALRTLAAPPRRRALLASGALAAVAGIATTAFALTRGASTCDDALPAWSADIERGLANQLQARPAVLARVRGFVEHERAVSHELLAGACKAPQSPTALRTKGCVLASWRWIDGNVRKIAAGRDVASALDELPVGVPMDHCAPGSVSATPPAVDADATPASRTLHVAIAATEGLPPDEAIRQLAALGPAVDAAGNRGLGAAWHLELADAQRRAGKERDAIASAEAAIDLATRNGDDLVLARARLHAYLLRDVPDRKSTVRDAEVEAIVARVGSPGLLATFHNAAGQRALSHGDIPRARSLLEQAATAQAALELAPSSQRGSAEQNLGVALQFGGDLDGAQAHFERAVEVFTARYGAGHEITAGARLNAAHNQLYRGKIPDAVAALDALAAELVAAKRDHTALGAQVAAARCQGGQASGHDALARCTEALALGRAVFGKGNVEIVPSLLAVAQLTMATSVRGALPYLEEAIAIAGNQAGNPTDLPYARGLYALALDVVGRKAEGRAIAKLAIGDLERLGQRELAAAVRQKFPAL
jgi:tetratricopeptide (TPR) repeat protein/predicted Ser/Thr protein kinase